MTLSIFLFFFFNDTATTEIYTLSLHDALPICAAARGRLELVRLASVHHHSRRDALDCWVRQPRHRGGDSGRHLDNGRPGARDRKSTRLNSSHLVISYAVFCLKKKKIISIRDYS